MLSARSMPQMAEFPAETCLNAGEIICFQPFPVGLFGVIPRRTNIVLPELTPYILPSLVTYKNCFMYIGNYELKSGAKRMKNKRSLLNNFTSK